MIRINKFGAAFPDRFTKSLWEFYGELQTNELFLVYMLKSQDFVDEKQEKAVLEFKELWKDESNELSKKMVHYFDTHPEVLETVFDIRQYEHYYGQMAFARVIDNVITYFKDILAEVIIKRPQILKSKESERLDFILDFDTIEDLRNALVEKKVSELFYKGIDDIEKYFIDRLGISLFNDKEDKIEFNRLIKQRNLIVHNRGRITKEFIKEFPHLENLNEGYYFSFTFEDISEANIELGNFICHLDEEIALKFGLDRFESEF
ncbi:MAG: hypothetical protein ACTHJT_12445 [Cytophaga sp.]|uniref:hypothetical protein n=1 Tax=Cytophaga sp. TaxID=29535 RepID=UPI003F7D99DA